ncbi:MAG: helix-turn-helix transcriptional regulator [Planctomycetaceae bacterium]|nr:helix-turn-helix transcriptional regulator [Planctomycetaceae bacterium]
MSIDVGSTLRMLREARKLSLKDVAKDAEISTPFLTLVEQGRRQPSLVVLRKLASALKVPVEALILASQPEDGTIRSSDAHATRIVKSVKRLRNVQEALRRELDAQNAAAEE